MLKSLNKLSFGSTLLTVDLIGALTMPSDSPWVLSRMVGKEWRLEMWEQDCQEKFQTKRDVRWKHFYPSEGQLGGKDLKVEADWFLDTGASTHIVADVNNLS